MSNEAPRRRSIQVADVLAAASRRAAVDMPDFTDEERLALAFPPALAALGDDYARHQHSALEKARKHLDQG